MINLFKLSSFPGEKRKEKRDWEQSGPPLICSQRWCKLHLMFPLLLITFPFYTNILEDNSPSIMRAPFEMLGILQLTFAIVPTLLEFRLCQWLCLKAWEGNEDSNGEIFVILRQQKGWNHNASFVNYRMFFFFKYEAVVEYNAEEETKSYNVHRKTGDYIIGEVLTNQTTSLERF